MTNRALALGAVVAALACGSARANVITYDLTGTASYMLAGVAHSGFVDIQGVGDTTRVVSQARAGGQLLELNGTLPPLNNAPFAMSVTLTGVGAFNVIGAGYVFDLLNATLAGFGTVAGADFIYIRSALLDHYDMVSALAPVSGVWSPAAGSVATTGGQLSFTSLSNAQFGARVTPSPAIPSPAASAPEPATWALLLTGVGGLGATLRARRKVLAAL